MRYKQDWDEAAERWVALWDGRPMDRPCMTVEAPTGAGRSVLAPRDGEQGFLDPDYVIDAMLGAFESTWYGGEAFPSVFLNAGWLATAYDAEVVLGTETIWFKPYEQFDIGKPPAFVLDFDSPWYLRYMELHERALEIAGADRFMMGEPALLPGDDLLSMLMGTTGFMIAMVEHPGELKAVLSELGDNYVAAKDHLTRLNAERNIYSYGAGWTKFWGPDPYTTIQSDVSCMISPEMYDEFVLPQVERAGDPHGRVWYHLDGPGALHHVPKLCSLDYIKVIQWVPGAGAPPHGPHWYDLYQEIQSAGKIVDISPPIESVEGIIKNCDPSLLCLHCECESVDEGRELIEAAKRWVKHPASRALGTV